MISYRPITIRGLLDSLSITRPKTTQKITVMIPSTTGLGSPSATITPPTTAPAEPTPPPSVSVSIPISPTSDETTKSVLKTQRLELSNTLIEYSTKKRVLLQDIAIMQDTIEFVLKQISDIDTKLNS